MPGPTGIFEGDSHLRCAHGPRVVRVVLLVDGLSGTEGGGRASTEIGVGPLRTGSKLPCYQVALHFLPQGGELCQTQLAVGALLTRRQGSSYWRSRRVENQKTKQKKDTSMRFTMTLHVSKLKPLVLMSLPVGGGDKSLAVGLPRATSHRTTHAWRRSCSRWCAVPRRRSPCPGCHCGARVSIAAGVRPPPRCRSASYVPVPPTWRTGLGTPRPPPPRRQFPVKATPR